MTSLGNMTRSRVLIIVGVALLVVGLIWLLQGVNVIGGSGMSGSTTWAVIGPVVALVGVGLIVAGTGRRTRSRPPR